MAFDDAAAAALFAQVQSHAMSLGLFERVNTHEPKSKPGSGLSCSIWLDTIEPVPDASGLAAVTGRITFHVRVYSNFLSKPEDDIDPKLLAAACKLLAEYSGNFTLGGTVRDIDLLGAHGQALSAQAGYLDQDGTKFRVVVIMLPVIINDLWGEVA